MCTSKANSDFLLLVKSKELESLAEAVRTENYRIYAYESQRR